ncbi:MAG: TatD family hydrolase [Pseudomonadota bacterium]
MLVDHHCHLDFPQFADDLDGLVDRARVAGVETIVTISTFIEKVDTYRTIAERFDNVYFSVGTHPHNADQELDVPVSDIVQLSQHPKCVAVGEAGLDYHYKNAPIEAQEAGFLKHIEAARETGLPLEIHTREADEHTLRVLRQSYAIAPFKAVLHCFTGGRELAMAAVEMEMLVSFSGVVTFKKAEELRAIAADIPLDHILVETDAPYLAPTPYRGKTNEPAYVAQTAQTLADVRGLSLDAFASATSSNFYRYYTKAQRPSGVAKPSGVSVTGDAAV